MWKENLELTKQHYIDWWWHKGIVLNMWEHFQTGVKPHADVPAPPAPKDLNQKWFDPEWRAEYLDWYVAHSCLKADMLPVANTQLGPGSLAAILGGVFEGGEDTIWIHPNPDYTDDITFNPEHPNYLLHKALLKACKQKAQGNYYVGMPDLMEGMDVLAALKGTDKVLMDTVTQPDVLEHQMQQINDIYFRVFDELYDIIREGDEMAFCYFSSWAPGKMAKLQSDISTMISVDDYRRFVQPFIRQQCQKIDYTLYHLDGVGALHHLPALLEIDELNAIQWTPGVGEPQGGSPKWYDLYKKILAAGKSIMACWVTVDELRPLLDNIGGDGVHLEMDFHNEAEVEQAMRIVEEYQSSESGQADKQTSRQAICLDGLGDDEAVDKIIDEAERLAADKAYLANSAHSVNKNNKPDEPNKPDIKAEAHQRMLVLDGAMGTMIQVRRLAEADFRGSRLQDHPVDVSGCNDLLCLTRPDVVKDIHRLYLEAGADIITTNTFNAQRISMADYRLEGLCREINLEACRLAREVADEFTKNDQRKPRFVAGSMGPTAKTCSMSTDTTQPGWHTFSYQKLLDAYAEQAEALVEGGVDAVLVETIFDTVNARAAVEAVRAAAKKAGREVPVMLSFTVSGGEGRNMLGQDIEAFVAEIMGGDILSVGVNCCADPAVAVPLLAKLGSATHCLISLYPNAGTPDAEGRYAMTPGMLQRAMWAVAEQHVVDIIGGCCGTTDTHIRKLSEIVEPIEGLPLTPHVCQQTSRQADQQTSRQVDEQASGQANKPANTAHPANLAHPANEPNKADEPNTPQQAADGVFDAILHGKADKAVEATRAALADGAAPQEIINGQMIRAMGEVGSRFEQGKAFVPQLLMAGRAMKAALELLKPMLSGSADATIGRVVIGTVKGDLHDIGKNLVASMLEGSGFEVENIGIDVPADKFVEAIKACHADILCMSALLTTTMTYMKDVISAIDAAGLRGKVKIMVGGAPVSQAFADEIGADGYSDNANEAVKVAKKLMQPHPASPAGRS